MNPRYGPLLLVVLLGSLGAPAHVRGQPTYRIGGGIALGLTPNLAEGFSNDQICKRRSAVSLSARMTVALTQVIQLEALAETFKGPPSSCVSAPSPPVPTSGPYTQIADYYEDRITDPPTVIALRVGGSLPKTGTHMLRPYVGIARFSGKGITTPMAGLSLLKGGSAQRLLLEIEGWS